MEVRRQKLPGGTFSVLTAGPEDGELVICLHGFPDHARTWEPTLERLASEGYRAVAPWLRGYAPSTLEGPFDMSRVGQDAVELADALSPLRPALIVGHDWGAMATFLALGQHPERFRKAVTMAVPHPGAWQANLSREQLAKSWYMMFFQLSGVSDWWVARDNFAFIDQLWRTWSPGYSPEPRYMDELKRCLWLSMPQPLRFYRAMFARMLNLKALQTDLRATANISVPTLHLHGASDGCVDPKTARDQKPFFRGAFRSEVISDAGHFLHLEQPDVVMDHLLTWFDAKAS